MIKQNELEESIKNEAWNNYHKNLSSRIRDIAKDLPSPSRTRDTLFDLANVVLSKDECLRAWVETKSIKDFLNNFDMLKRAYLKDVPGE